MQTNIRGKFDANLMQNRKTRQIRCKENTRQIRCQKKDSEKLLKMCFNKSATYRIVIQPLLTALTQLPRKRGKFDAKENEANTMQKKRFKEALEYVFQ